MQRPLKRLTKISSHFLGRGDGGTRRLVASRAKCRRIVAADFGAMDRCSQNCFIFLTLYLLCFFSLTPIRGKPSPHQLSTKTSRKLTLRYRLRPHQNAQVAGMRVCVSSCFWSVPCSAYRLSHAVKSQQQPSRRFSGASAQQTSSAWTSCASFSCWDWSLSCTRSSTTRDARV